MEKKDENFEDFFQKLPQKDASGSVIAQYKGFWFDAGLLHGTITFHDHFKANDSDIILATMPKSGTTWLKALTFSIINRKIYSNILDSPLLFNNPHQLIPFLETHLYEEGKVPDINSIPSPHIFSTHIPYQCLPNTILVDSGCRVIYICRNALEIFTSMRYFTLQNGWVRPDSMYTDGAYELFCEGTTQYGPFWDHDLGYWEASLKNPKKILFLKYEDLKKDVISCMKKLAEFLGCGFSPQEESEGKGEIGDCVNFLTPSMAEHLESVMKEKFKESGLSLCIHG
ncbi:OLC1v1009177C1 [Oldenlandia corymbosa var. corymbosa]|uniref:Sulfotransferase n=1 Tax=Oldenlandia corymbosa var. corymbosa TaxID=529605 RepID=A0AAV1DQP6_OLDCO|nr:OLC1v1009177C1 [Oldenlandia corymbosa var. corymbosa]